MSLIEIHPSSSCLIDLGYGHADNFTGQKIYTHPRCYLHKEAAEKLQTAEKMAANLGYALKIFDAFRPTEAQWKLWEICPNPMYIADPRRGSNHSRGIAVDLTLVDALGQELDMGTPIDDLTERSHHFRHDISPEAQKNRFILLGIMAGAGWDHYKYEWWHYQLFNVQDYPFLSDHDAPLPLMGA